MSREIYVPNNSMESINDYLPREVLVKIFSYYIESEGPVKFLKNVSPVCKSWKDLCYNFSLWKEVSWRSMSWNLDNLLKLGERGFLASTRVLNLSCKILKKEDLDVIKSVGPNLGIDDLLQLIDCCHNNVKVLDISCNNNLIFGPEVKEMTAQFIARRFPIFDEDGSKWASEWLLDIVRNSSRFESLLHNDRVVSKVADCCTSLEEFHYYDYPSRGCKGRLPFPIDKLQRGCRKLRVLKIAHSKVFFSNDEEHEGFEELRSFSACNCEFSKGLDVGEILKNSTELEDLHLDSCNWLTCCQLHEIPSETVKTLDIEYFDDPEYLEKAVKKWRRTLKKFSVCSYGRDVTNTMIAFEQDNEDPVIEEIILTEYVDVPFMKKLVRKCKKLSYLDFSIDKYEEDRPCFNGREEIEKFSQS